MNIEELLKSNKRQAILTALDILEIEYDTPIHSIFIDIIYEKDNINKYLKLMKYDGLNFVLTYIRDYNNIEHYINVLGSPNYIKIVNGITFCYYPFNV